MCCVLYVHCCNSMLYMPLHVVFCIILQVLYILLHGKSYMLCCKFCKYFLKLFCIFLFEDIRHCISGGFIGHATLFFSHAVTELVLIRI